MIFDFFDVEIFIWDFGFYKFVQCFGVGGMGEVWEVEQMSLVRCCVVFKFIKVGMDSVVVVSCFEVE